MIMIDLKIFCSKTTIKSSLILRIIVHLILDILCKNIIEEKYVCG